jgi:bacteriocin-like protein
MNSDQDTKTEPEQQAPTTEKQKLKPAEPTELSEKDLDKVSGGQATPIRNLRG